jgi:hypothetical protein
LRETLFKDTPEYPTQAVTGKAVVGGHPEQMEREIFEAAEKILFRSAGTFLEFQLEFQVKLVTAQTPGFTHKMA